MTPTPHSAPEAARHFRPLEHTDFQRLEHATFLKGLLKPFKGKGALEDWAGQCEALRDGLIALAQRQVLRQASSYLESCRTGYVASRILQYIETVGIDMKGRESGMPDEVYWSSFFKPEIALDLLLPSDARNGDIVEFGSGYGTFTLPVARRIKGHVNALDIELEIIDLMLQKADAEGLRNIRGSHRDFLANGTGLSDGSQRHAMIYNLLHIEHPVDLLHEAHRVLNESGSLSVMHWRSDIPTPRGPSQAIRPTSKQCLAWMEEAGFRRIKVVNLDRCCPYHFGLLGWV